MHSRGNDAIYLRTFSDASMVATCTKIAGGKVSNRLQSGRLLTDGKVTLVEHLYGNPDGKITRGTIINPGSEEFYKTAGVPLAMGFPDNARDDISRTARLIRDGSSGVSLGAIQDDAIFDGVKMVRIEVKGPGGKRVIWVDPERGAIPVRVHDEMPGGSAYDLRYGDIRMVAGRGWLPYEPRSTCQGGRVFRTIITKVDFGKIPDDTFRIEFPEPIAIINVAKGLSYRPQKIWELSRLPKANSRETAPLMTSLGTPDPVMPGEREPHMLLFTFVALGLSAVVGVIGFLWKRGTSASR